MKLQQLRYIVAVAQAGLNITEAARRLNSSQSGVSRQILLLEHELGFPIFIRESRAIARLTPEGDEVIKLARRALHEVRRIRTFAKARADDPSGTLTLGTTHTHARHTLPPVLAEFRPRYPKVRVHIEQGTPEQIAALAAADEIDFALATGPQERFPDLTLLPCFKWHRAVVVPKGHPLVSYGHLTLRDLAQYPIVTYTSDLAGPASLHEAFAKEDLEPDLAITARDSDVLKTYIRLGLGIGLIASIAIDPRHDTDLATLDARHLFPPSTTWIGFRRGLFLRRYMHDFIHLLAPHLDRDTVDRANQLASNDDITALLHDIALPLR